MNTQLKKGILEMCILHYIEKESMYGYDIIQSMHSYLPEVAESAFYAILRRLNNEGDAVSFRSEISKGADRKYYTITEQGRERLMRMKDDWGYLKRVMDEIGI